MAKFKKGDLVVYKNKYCPNLNGGVAVITEVSPLRYIGDEQTYSLKWIVEVSGVSELGDTSWHESFFRHLKRGRKHG